VFDATLGYSDLLLLKRQLDYVALGGCDEPYESEGWVYNPGSGGFYHVTVDTAVQPKHIARHVPYPPALAVHRPVPSVRRVNRAVIEEDLFDHLAVAAGRTDRDRELRRDVLRLVTQSIWQAGDAADLQERLLEAAARERE